VNDRRLLTLLKRLEQGGFCRDSTTAQCPGCGAYGDNQRVKNHVEGCGLVEASKWVEDRVRGTVTA
jgi:hypothetical protein